MTNPQPGFFLLFHEEQPYARLLPRMSPPQRGQVAIVSRTTLTAERTSWAPSSPTICGTLPSPITSLAGCGPSTSIASPCSSRARTSVSPTVKPFWVFQMVNPQPGSSLLFQELHPKARRFSLISPSPFGHGPSAPVSGLPCSSTISGVLPSASVSRAGTAASSGAAPSASRRLTSSAVIVKLPCVFQIVNPQPGSFLLLYEVQPNAARFSRISPSPLGHEPSASVSAIGLPSASTISGTL